jgi:hypothetical protein
MATTVKKAAPAKKSAEKPSPKKASSTKKVVTDEDIRKRAFEIHKEKGGKSHPVEDWLQAERELKGRK